MAKQSLPDTDKLSEMSPLYRKALSIFLSSWSNYITYLENKFWVRDEVGRVMFQFKGPDVKCMGKILSQDEEYLLLCLEMTMPVFKPAKCYRQWPQWR